MESDAQIIARKDRERAVKKAWRSFIPVAAAGREVFANRATLRWMPKGEIIQAGDYLDIGFRFTKNKKRESFTSAPTSHIGKPVRRSRMYLTSRPAPRRDD